MTTTTYAFTRLPIAEDWPGSSLDGYAGAYNVNDAGRIAGQYNLMSGDPYVVVWEPPDFRPYFMVDSSVWSATWDLNQQGHVAGSGEFGSNCVWTSLTSGPLYLPDLPPYASTKVYGLNDVGQAAGSVGAAGSNERGVFWSSYTTTPVLLPPLDVPGTTRSRAYDLSNNGVICGYTYTSSSQFPTYWTASNPSTPIALPLAPGATGGRATSVSSVTGIIAGNLIIGGQWLGALWYPPYDEVIVLPPLGDTNSSFCWNVNDAGMAVGASPYGDRGVVWSAEDNYQQATLLPAPSGLTIDAFGVNNEGWIVGEAAAQNPDSSYTWRAVLWRPESKRFWVSAMKSVSSFPQNESQSYVGQYTSSSDTWDFTPPRRPLTSFSEGPYFWGIVGERLVGMSPWVTDVFNGSSWESGSTAEQAVNLFFQYNGGQTSDGTYVYALGTDFTTQASKFARYNPVTDTWTLLTPPSQPRGHASLCYAEGKIFVFAGQIASSPYNDTMTTLIYDIATDTWTSGAPMPAMNGYRFQALAVPAMNRKIFVVGGFGSGTNTYPPIKNNRCTRYDIATDSWTEMAPMPSGYGADAPGGAFNPETGMLHLFSGDDWPTAEHRYRWHMAYDTEMNTWTVLGSLPDLPNEEQWAPAHAMAWLRPIVSAAAGIYGWGIVLV